MTESYPESGSKARAVALSRDFICVRYREEDGRHRPEIPDGCPVAITGSEPKGPFCCSLGTHHYRSRKTGPPFPLAVLQCSVHQACFTVYPMGFAPYLRQPVAIVDPAADFMEDVAQSPLSSDGGGGSARDFEGTLFEAGFDSSDGIAWARESGPPGLEFSVPDRWWSTQLRRLRLETHALGLDPDLDAETRVRIGEVLGIPTTQLRDLGRNLTGYRATGKAIRSVLDRLRPGISRALDLLTCLHLAGFFGRPRPWARRYGFLPRRAFPSVATSGGG